MSPNVTHLKRKVGKEIQSQQNARSELAILDFTDFHLNDQYELLRSRSNANFRNKLDPSKRVMSPFQKPKILKNAP